MSERSITVLMGSDYMVPTRTVEYDWPDEGVKRGGRSWSTEEANVSMDGHILLRPRRNQNGSSKWEANIQSLPNFLAKSCTITHQLAPTANDNILSAEQETLVGCIMSDYLLTSLRSLPQRFGSGRSRKTLLSRS
ncbi:hypothetical protein HAX54_028667 [Datura stramonium]|uniref:Uncharacterized protein n=1 Tax=Datura stramonium TaxID=4076 RepID=A0ABS8V7E9_DATST|nr:hypothetical protein [Datura stramonium]